MGLPLRHKVYDMIRDAKSITDVELARALAKAEAPLPEDIFNKALLDLEVLGLISVTWLAKETRRIEAIEQNAEHDAVEEEAARAAERDYEASFPGARS